MPPDPSTRSLRVLIATVTAGAGHLQAAAALEEAWSQHRPHDDLQKLDLLDFVNKLQRKVYAEGYTKIVTHTPALWGAMFERTDDPDLMRRLNRYRRMFARATNRRFVRHLRSFQPEILVATHFLPLEVIGHVKGRGVKPFTVSVVTDFEAHALWLEPAVDLYCVAAEATRPRLLARGVAPHQVVATGIPVSSRFASPPSRTAARKAFGLRNDLPVVLVLSGGLGMGPIAKLVSALDGVDQPVQVVVVAGRNLDLRRQLATSEPVHPTRVLGFVTNMEVLMSAADLIVSKPGGLTTSESLALGRPLMIVNPIPGQEAANSDFLLSRQAAEKVNRVEDLPYRLNQLLGSTELRTLARKARQLGRPHAAERIIQEIISRIS